MNYSNKTNRTKERITESLLTLMSKKSFNKISISQIAIEAEVNRSTVYRFFDDKYDIIEDRENKFFEEIKNARGKIDIFSFKQRLDGEGEGLYKILRVIDSNRIFLKIIMGVNGEPSFSSRFRTFLLKESQEQRSIIQELLPNINSELVEIYHISATFGIIQYWINNDYLTINEIYDFFKKYSMQEPL